jgi:hypothetical protein
MRRVQGYLGASECTYLLAQATYGHHQPTVLRVQGSGPSSEFWS